MSQKTSNACGLLFCFNEEHIIQETLYHYLRMGIDIVVFDNESTDSSRDKINQAAEKTLPGKILEIVTVKTLGFEWIKILKAANKYMHNNLTHYDWIFTIDADSFYDSPVSGLSLLKFLSAVKKNGYNVVEGDLYEFYPTEKDDINKTKATDRLLHYRKLFRLFQQKIFAYHPTVNFYESQGHYVQRRNAKVFHGLKFIYRHYPWVSIKHGKKKVFKERKNRYDRHSVNRPDYRAMLPQNSDLLKKSNSLKVFTRRTGKVPRFSLLLFFIAEYARVRTKPLAKKRLPKLYQALKNYKQSVQTLGMNLEDNKDSFAEKPPHEFHFLMTNTCNAQCTFCNQDFEGILTRPGKKVIPGQLSLMGFKKILGNLKLNHAKDFYFSGGGDPLLCKELVPILDFTEKYYPWIKKHLRTNGIGLIKVADKLAGLNIDIEISLHGPPEQNDKILNRPGLTQEIFSGIEKIRTFLSPGHRVKFSFLPVVSKLNIESIPRLIEIASEIGVEAIIVYFTVYPQQPQQGLNKNDSLFFHKKIYNDTITQCQETAAKHGIKFIHQPLFGETFEKNSCRQPWDTMVVNWDGQIFPCCGGDVWFRSKIEDKTYHIGNLFEESIEKIWNNDFYLSLRRTCLDGSKKDEGQVSECIDCHQVGYFNGPDDINGHVLRK